MGEESGSDCLESTFGIFEICVVLVKQCPTNVERSIHFLSVSETMATCFVPFYPVSSMFLMSFSAVSSLFCRHLHHPSEKAVPLVTHVKSLLLKMRMCC